MIPLTNHDFQWGRSEVVIIYPDKLINTKRQQHILHPQQGIFVVALLVLPIEVIAQDVAAQGLRCGPSENATGPCGKRKTNGRSWKRGKTIGENWEENKLGLHSLGFGFCSEHFITTESYWSFWGVCMAQNSRPLIFTPKCQPMAGLWMWFSKCHFRTKNIKGFIVWKFGFQHQTWEFNDQWRNLPNKTWDLSHHIPGGKWWGTAWQAGQNHGSPSRCGHQQCGEWIRYTLYVNICTYRYEGFHKWGYPKWMVYTWFIIKNPIKIDDLGVPPISGNLYMITRGSKSKTKLKMTKICRSPAWQYWSTPICKR